MQRYILHRSPANPMMMPGVSDEESLLIQLCEYLHDSGFLYNDATAEEIERGQSVVQDFFEQEGEFVMQYLSEELLRKFVSYVQEHQWSKEEIEQKLRMKTVKAFDQLARGASHSWNIPRNIRLGLMQFQEHVLQDFLLYLTAYHQLLLEEDENPVVDATYTVNDLMRMREELVERLEGRKLVELILSDISRQRGGHMPLQEEKAQATVQFVRPNQLPQEAVRPQPSETKAPSSTISTSKSASPANKTTRSARQEENKVGTLQISEDEMQDLEFEEDESSSNDDEANVVYGIGQINREAAAEFIQQHTDSALKFLFRRDVTEKALPMEVVKIHEEWEARGLKRGFIRKYIMELMEWEEWPTGQTIIELVHVVKDRVYDLLHGNLKISE